MTLQQIAKEAWEANDGDMAAAIKQATERLSEDAQLYQTVTATLIDSAIRNSIQEAMRATRKNFWPESTPRVDTYGAILRNAERALLDYPLPNGLKLGDAKKADVVSAATQLVEVGRTSIKRGKWLECVASELKSARAVVREQLSNADLRRLQRRVEGAPYVDQPRVTQPSVSTLAGSTAALPVPVA